MKLTDKFQICHFIMSFLPNNQGATLSPFSESFIIVSGTGNECLTIAPYKPYSAMIDALPQHFSVFLHFARRF